MLKKILLVVILLCNLIPSAAFASFSDVESGALYEESITWLQEQGITPPDKAKFSPEKLMTKGDLYELAWRAAGYKPEPSTKVSTPFSDLSSASRYAPYAKKAFETGIIKEKGLFNPGQKMKRIEVLETLFAVMGIGITRHYGTDEIIFKDIRPKSAYAPIVKTAQEFGIRVGNTQFKPKEKVTRAEVADYIHTISTQITTPTQTIQIIQIPSSGNSDNTFANNDKFKILLDVWNRIHEKYVGKEKLDDKKLLYGAISGMVNKLGDKYTVFQEPATAKNFSESLTGEFDGIGVSIDLIENKVRIISPIQGTPASKAGLKSKDIILEIDKKSTAGLTLPEVSALIKGPTGTKVELLIERDGKKISFSITRERIRLDAIVAKMKGKVAYIIVRNFTQSSGLDFAVQAKKLLEKNPTSFVIDLRDNPGGYLDASLQMLDTFLPKKTRLASLKFSKRENAEEFLRTSVGGAERAEIDAIDPEVIFYSIGEGELANYPIKVLINGGSASASEIVAASLKENNHATLIGEKSFGKGTVQEIADYNDGSLYKQTIAKWQTPNEKNLTENPIVPDIEIKDDPKTDEDEALEYALKH